jgi:hypothetical protein
MIMRLVIEFLDLGLVRFSPNPFFKHPTPTNSHSFNGLTIPNTIQHLPPRSNPSELGMQVEKKQKGEEVLEVFNSVSLGQ